MNYLLQDMPTYQMVEMEQVNIMVGLVGIMVIMGVLGLMVNHIIKSKKTRRKSDEETN